MIIPNLWFDKNAEAAVNFYLSVFKDGKIYRILRYGKERHDPGMFQEGDALTIEFEIQKTHFVAINGGPHFQLSEAISLLVECDDQAEIDYYWDRLSEDGDSESQACGWLKDKFGLSWQIMPRGLSDWLSSDNTARNERVMKALLNTKNKIILADLRAAYENK